jgi:excisionase family DNA binding protein
MRELGTAERIAARCRVHPETLRRLYREGRVPGYKFGRVLRFDLDEVCDALRTTPGSATTRAHFEPDFDALDRGE